MIKNDFDFNKMKMIHEDLITSPYLSENNIFFKIQKANSFITSFFRYSIWNFTL